MNAWNFYTTKELKPTGWLLRQLNIQAEALSGNLHKIWPDIRDSAWIGGKCEGWERVPYWLDGFIPLAYLLENEEMISTAKKYVDCIISKQQDDGWICPCKSDEIAKYDTWALQLICKTLKVYYECSSDERIPLVIYKAMKNYYELLKSKKISLFGWGKFRWFETFISLNFLYEKYQEDWIKDLAKMLKEQGFDYHSAVDLWKKPKRKWKMETHIVNLTMMLKSEAISHNLLNDEYCDKAEELRKILDEYNSTVFEGFTGDEVLSGIDPTKGTELCAIVEQMYSYEHLLAHTSENKWAERLEVLAFNALPATISEDMWTHQYVQMVNQIACKKTRLISPFGTNSPSSHLFGLEPNFGCCTANFNQGWPKLALTPFMHKNNTIFNALMLPCVLKDDKITIKLETNYPFNNKATYYIEAEKDFDFVIRIPSFAVNLKLNGEKTEEKNISLSVKAGKTKLEIEFDTVPILKKRPNNLYALQSGSLIFSVPVAHKKVIKEYTRKGVERKFPYCDYELIPESAWNYGFADTEFEISRNAVGDIPFSMEKPPVTVKAKMQKIKWGFKIPFNSVCRKTPVSTDPISEANEIELIPYGCAKLRMTEMPLLNKPL